MYIIPIFFFIQRQKVLESFNSLFNDTGSDNNDVSSDGKAERIEAYGWFSILYTLAEGDPTKYSAINELNIYTALNTLAFKKLINSK